MSDKVVAFSCLHSPFTRRDAFAWLISIIRKERPTHIVNLGDWLEADAASVHPDEHQHTLDDEYRVAASQSAQIRKAAPKASLTWLLGNHDDNLQIKDARRIPKQLREALHWNNSRAYGDEFRAWKQVPYEKSKHGCIHIGPITLLHGFDCGQNADQREAIEFAMMTGGQPGRLFVRGHTHRPVRVTQCQWNANTLLPWWYANVGTLGPLKPQYAMRRNTTRWGAACLVAEVKGWKWTAEVREFRNG